MIEADTIGLVRSMIGTDIGSDDRAFADACRRLAREQGRLGEGEGLDGVVPVPEGAFKESVIASFHVDEAEAVFRTSGTTSGAPGTHYVRDLGLYRSSAVDGFRRFVMYAPEPRGVLSLIPGARERPGSSLSHMASFVAEVFGAGRSASARRGERIDIDAAVGFFRDAVGERGPVLVIGTSLDFQVLLSGLRERSEGTLSLPPGSRVMHTGGEKASGRELSRGELQQGLMELLGIEADDVVEEFGMTELMSQAYDSPRVTPGPRRLVPVPWMRTRVLDPETMTDVPEGARGMLCHYDLANCHTAVAVLTNDLATRVEDGFTDISRVHGAAPRGCSHDAATGSNTKEET